MAIIVKSKDSLLTTSSGYTNYRGILNLVIILLVLSNARAALENIIKYGILVDPLSWFLFLREGPKHWPALLILLGMGLNVLISLVIEKIIASLCHYGRDHQTDLKDNKKSPEISNRSTIVFIANASLVVNLFACISLPPVAVYTHDTHPISTSASLMVVSIVFIKLVSYHMMNFWCRDLRQPERLQSRTTKSFLRSYTPPALDFDAVVRSNLNKEANEKSECLPANSSNSVKVKSSAVSKDEARLRKRLNDEDKNISTSNTTSNNSNNHQSCKTAQPTAAKCVSKEELQSKSREAALKALAKYPDNITIRNMISYMMFPTLCYELEYAQTERIRKRFLIKRIIELIVLSQLDMALIQQWIVPTVSNSVLPFRQMQFSHMLERLLKLAIPNHVIWLIWFYLFFHSLLNIVAELTRFADREFYRDWWNSESVYYFWSNWNIPVHKWCARHLYVPLMALGLSKCQASTAVFFVSAFFHEYLVSVPLKMFRMWAFTGMVIQLPWARFVSSYFNNHFANVAVWVSLIIGQPLCILMYYHDYYVINNVKSLPSR